MQSRLIVRRGAVPGDRIASLSIAAFEVAKKRAELWIVEPTSPATLLGAFQPGEAPRRASGGAEVALGPGTLHVMLALPSLAMLEARPSVILNRAVRPFLRALTRKGALAHYFGRDWVSAAGRPVALASFAHEAATQRTLVELSISVHATCMPRTRASYRDAEPATLASLGGSITTSEVGDRALRAVLDAYGLAPEERAFPDDGELGVAMHPVPARPTLTTVHADAIGPIGVGADATGTLRFGGELMASFDAIASLESSLRGVERGDVAVIQSAVERSLARPEVALFGVRALDAFVELVHAPEGEGAAPAGLQ